MSNEKNNVSSKKEEKASAFGGYSTRYDWEKSAEKKGIFKKIFKSVLLFILFALSTVGVIALLRGAVFPDGEIGGKNAGSIKVPTQQELAEKEKTTGEMLSRIEPSLMTLEVIKEDGSVTHATGFLVSSEGHGVCASSVFGGEVPVKSITVYTGERVVASATYLGEEESLGVGLILLSSAFEYTPVSAENSSFVNRGEVLFAVPSQKAKIFYGTVASGVVASVGPYLRIGEPGYEMSVNMIYLNMTANPTMYGAPVVDSTGAVVGILTDKVPPLQEGLSSVVPINMVYTVVNNILSQQ
ncbi:MAG: trypsin-like peptidase domain-containing protein [Clostridia bacterium]|nr:trypsin-like peptidase domain-containing protein [Clostridia bacterium]